MKDLTKIIQKYNSYIGLVNKIGEYLEAIYSLPPRGEGAKAQVHNEIEELFRQLNGQSKSLELDILMKINED